MFLKIAYFLSTAAGIGRPTDGGAGIVTEGATQSLALLGPSKADLAVARGDLDMPREAEAVIIVRNNVVVLWSPSGLPGRGSKKQTAKIQAINEL